MIRIDLEKSPSLNNASKTGAFICDHLSKAVLLNKDPIEILDWLIL